MEDLETNLFQTRKARRIEQMVARWLRRSRDSISRGRSSVVDVPSDGLNQPVTRVKLTVTVHKDLLLGHYGFEISPNPPPTIASVAAGSTADGKLLPGDHILTINNEAVEDISIEQAADLLREPEDSLLLTVLRCTSGGPKSSFLTAEKRARLKTNPVKVRFAEEVLVNGHTQGNALLCVPNVLKVYLENGQTKAFKFDTTTTVKDIILTLKEKLSIQSIEHFALALEEQYNISKIYLLHEDELIEQVVQRKDSHDYRCLFRVCFIPKDPLDLLQEDPVTFEYLYLQSCSDVLQERFAVEMKCSVALRLAALHIQERIYACAQPQKVSFKYIEKDWGIENFISPTLLRNMKGKDIKKAISFHMKRNQILLDPRQKHVLSATQVRLSYLQILGDLKMYSGKIFNATLMLQDRESYVALLVGAKYGISQIINNKLNIISPLAEFANIGRLELTEESEKASMVKIYLQDVKLLTLMLESNSAKDLACLIAGYYRLCVDSGITIFMWGEAKQQAHRISTEEGSKALTREGKGDSCFLKKSRCYNLGESCMSRQATREKHRKEKELKHAKSLRKRRSFLQTDYTSQVTFPVAPSPALESADPACCSERESQLPSISLTRMTSSLDDTTGEPPLLAARTFAQLEPRSQAKSKNPSSAFMEMEPDATETNSVTASVIPSISASQLQGDQEGKETLDLTPLPSCAENSLGPLGSACARDSGCVSPEIAFHLGGIRNPEQAGGAWDSPGGCGRPFSETEDGCITRTVPQEQPMPQSAAEALEAHRELETSAQPGEGGIPASAVPVLSPLGCYRGKPLPQAAASDLGSLSTADKGEACEQFVPSSPFARGTGGPTSCAVKPEAEMVSGEKTNTNLNEEPLKRVEDKNHVGFSNATELLSDFNGASGIITRLSWLSFGTRTDQAMPCQQGGIEDTDQAVDQRPWTAEHSDSGALRKETHFSSASPKARPPPELLSGQRTEEREPREDALYVDGRPEQPQPTLTPLLTEETAEQRKGCHFNTSPGLRSPSPKDTDGASAHREGNFGADQSLLCVAHEKDAPVSTSCSTTRPLGLTSVKGTLFPKAGTDKCSCHLSYASCFRGLDNDLDYEYVDSAHSTSSRPLTTPPAAGSLSFLDQPPPRTTDESVSENGPWPETHLEALAQLQERAGKSSADFSPFLANVAELQAIVRQFSGNRTKHPRDACAEHYSEHKHVLCAESRKLMASCQKVLQPDRPSEELSSALQETFQDLMRLTALCFQFTACGLCGRRHKELTVNLKDVVCTYHQFVLAALQTGGKDCRDFSATLLARQGTALTAAVFCLTQRFRAAPAV
ncbi:FERM and PDZ domain-containing protein 1 isoform X4 [Chrysemys picta bellii]|uniref:FERM and PDZ domain-containing protein 1 isoform X4 n=1 Tax=Chrysemys picta bellii TaxID=8478 RepID=UPI0032B2DA6D